jgi:hypothetical protein
MAATAKHTTGTTALRMDNTVPPVAKTMNPAEGRMKPKRITEPKKRKVEAPTVAKSTAGSTMDRPENRVGTLQLFTTLLLCVKTLINC